MNVGPRGGYRAAGVLVGACMRIGYEHADSLLTYPDVNNLSTSSQPIRVRPRFPDARVGRARMQ